MDRVSSWIQDVKIEDLERDPDGIYKRIRKEAPIAFVPAVGAYVAATKDLCRQIANDEDSFEGSISSSNERTHGSVTILNSNGAQHDVLRAMVDCGLRPAEVDGYIDDLARPIARRLIKSFEDDGRAELLGEFCEPLSVRSLGDMLGLRSVTSDKLREWFHALSESASNQAISDDGTFANPDGFVNGDKAKAEIRAVVDPLMAVWATDPDSSALSRWMHDGMPEGQVRSPELIYPNLFVILLGGMQEPGNAMASTIAGLFTRPDQLERVADDPTLIPRAINEGLRWVAPIWSAASRRSVKETDVNGTRIPHGSVVMMSYGSANHDEHYYDHPTAYDLDRATSPSMAFGAGRHACAGAYFATQVCRIGLEELFDAIPNLEPGEPADVGFWGWAFRGPKELHAKWTV